MLNRLNTTKNIHQGKTKKVLCVCSAGCLRSPTAAVVLSAEPFNLNTRAAGIVSEYAIIPVDNVLVQWADLIVCMEETHHEELIRLFTQEQLPEVLVLNIPDRFAYRDPNLMEMIAKRFQDYLEEVKGA